MATASTVEITNGIPTGPIGVYTVPTLQLVLDSLAGTQAGVSASGVGQSLVGGTSVALKANPAEVTAGQVAPWNTTIGGIPFVLNGHPNIIVRSNTVLDSDGAQANASLVGTIAANVSVVITQLWVKADKNNSGNVAVRIGFGTASVPSPTLAGTAGILIDEDLGAGEGHQLPVGMIAIGASGEELRITCDDPAGGALYVGYSYFTMSI